jgi:hypothetical protein
LSPAGVVDRREIIYPISLAVALRFGMSPGTVQHFRGQEIARPLGLQIVS